MSKKCISNNINWIRSCAYQYDLKCSAPNEQYQLCYRLRYESLNDIGNNTL